MPGPEHFSKHQKSLFSLYRHTIRVARSFPDIVPGHIKEKFEYNINWAFRTYRDEKDPEKSRRLLERGRKAVEGFEVLANSDPEILEHFLRKKVPIKDQK